MSRLNLFKVFSDSIKRQVEQDKTFKSNLTQIGTTSQSIYKNAPKINEPLTKLIKPISEGVSSVLNPIAKTIELGYTATEKIMKPITDSNEYQRIGIARMRITEALISSPLEISGRSQRDLQKLQMLKMIQKPAVDAPEESTALVVSTRKFRSFGFLNLKESMEARTIRMFRTVDLGFDRYRFLTTLQKYIIPEIVEAYSRSDLATLRKWTNETAYARVEAEVNLAARKKLVNKSVLLDIKQVNMARIEMDDEGGDDIPVIQVTVSTDELAMFCDGNGKIVEGSDSDIKNCVYAFSLTKRDFVTDSQIDISEEFSDSETMLESAKEKETTQLEEDVTGGWVVIEWSRGSF